MSSTFVWPDGVRAAVSLSFDDARLSQVDVGIPILDQYDVKGTFYVILNKAKKRTEEWKQAVASGHEIGNHTVHHPCTGNFGWTRQNALEDYDEQRMQAEFDEADKGIEQMLGVKPRTFAYPCGNTFMGRGEHQKSYVPLVARHFEIGRAFLNETSNDPAFCDLAMTMASDFDKISFDHARTLIDTAIEQGHWLIFAGHEVGEPARQTVPAKTLDEVCAYCTDSSNGVWIDTVADIGAYVRQQRGG